MAVLSSEVASGATTGRSKAGGRAQITICPR